MTSIQTTFMTVGKSFMIFSLFFAVPLNLFPARETIFEAFRLEKNNKNHIICSVTLALTSCAIAIAFQKVNSYFGLLGGTAGVMMAGGIPSLCYWKLMNPSQKEKGMIIFMSIISVLGMIGAIMSVVDA
jgi:hypothetical protein